MDALKKFFEKKKSNTKFKHVGAGQSLTGSGGGDGRGRGAPRRASAPPPHTEPRVSVQRAGEAALSRYTNDKRNTPVNWSKQAIKAQVRRELEAEKRLQELNIVETAAAAAPPPPPKERLIVQHVMFSCPLISPEVGTHAEVKESIRSWLHAQLQEDACIASCLILHTCNKSQDKILTCVETLTRYLDNIGHSPDEEKFRKIRCSNKAYQERVQPLEGAVEFLEAVGFNRQELPFNDTTDTFWVFPSDGDLVRLKDAGASLVCAEAVRPTLERSPEVLLPQEAIKKPKLPQEFFLLSKEEIMKEQQLRNDVLEETQMLRTKAMRDRHQQRQMRKYRFTLIRVRFPDALTLQGTFRISEKLSSVMEFVRGFLENDWRPFFLTISGGGKLSAEDEERSLVELFLIPTSLLNFSWDSDVRDVNLDDDVTLAQHAFHLIRGSEREERQEGGSGAGARAT